MERYQASLGRVDGITWQGALTDPINLYKYQHALKAVALLPPGYVERTYPPLHELSLTRATDLEHGWLEHQLKEAFLDAIAKNRIHMAFRYAFVQILHLRSMVISLARPTTTTTTTNYYVLRGRAAYPPLPRELATVLHSISYGTSTMETLCRQALGIAHVKGSFAGVRAVMPLFTVNSVRHAKLRAGTTQYVDIPSLIFKVRKIYYMCMRMCACVSP